VDFWENLISIHMLPMFQTLKGLSYEIGFENVYENLKILALTRAAADF
jgi:hypothetical protein